MKKSLSAAILVAVFASTAHAAAVDEFRAPPSRPAATVNDYEQGKAMADKKDWRGAIAAFEKVVAREPNNADAHNMLGFSHRNGGNWDTAIKHYKTALGLNANHRGANEYIGRAYLMRGNVALAEQHLATLVSACGQSCEETRSLQDAIVEYKKNPR
jgi:Flp pilus assembly protein TadD